MRLSSSLRLPATTGRPDDSKLRSPLNKDGRRLSAEALAKADCFSKINRNKVRTIHASAASMYVYRLTSQNFPNQVYTGITTNPKQRLVDHNAGKSTHTQKFKPWKMEVCLWFADERKARAFEQYLKSGSGRAFSNKHF